MSRWSSKYAFLQDLAEVTHGQLPGESDDEDDQTADEIEEFLRQGAGATGDSELLNGPDLSSLKELLSMVKQETSPGPDGDGLDEGAIIISKLNADALPFVLETKETPLETKLSVTKKKTIKQRNIAIESILETLELEAEKENLQIHENTEEKPNIDNGPILKLGMFKKKLSPKKEAKIPLEDTSPSASLKTKSFVPSEHVKSVTKKPFIWDGKREDSPVTSSGKSPANDILFNNHNMVWTKVDMELRKKADEKAINMLCALNLKAFENGVLDRLTIIGLPQHRHDMQKECVVCKVLCSSK